MGMLKIRAWRLTLPAALSARPHAPTLGPAREHVAYHRRHPAGSVQLYAHQPAAGTSRPHPTRSAPQSRAHGTVMFRGRRGGTSTNLSGAVHAVAAPKCLDVQQPIQPAMDPLMRKEDSTWLSG